MNAGADLTKLKGQGPARENAPIFL